LLGAAGGRRNRRRRGGTQQTAKAARKTTSSCASPLHKVTSVDIYTLDANDGLVGQPQALSTDASGRLDVSVPASGGTILTLIPSVEGGDPAPSGGVDPQTYTYMYIRTLRAYSRIGRPWPPAWTIGCRSATKLK
jgi:hypothetical protein